MSKPKVRRHDVVRGSASTTTSKHDVIIVPVGKGLPDLSRLRRELRDMVNVLMGREEPPINAGVLTLQEVATAYYCRAKEIEMRLHKAEAEGTVMRGSAHYKFRTGELRDFIELSNRAADLGSRRVTAAQLELEMRRG